MLCFGEGELIEELVGRAVCACVGREGEERVEIGVDRVKRE